MTASRRIAALDLLRGTALIGMIVYHAAYDGTTYWQWDIDVTHGGWKWLARATAALFLLVSGAAVTLSEERLSALPTRERRRRRLERAGTVAAAALLVSIVTFWTDPSTYVRFGILHLVATGRLLLPLSLRARAWNLPFGIAFLTFGMRMPLHGPALLLPLGVTPVGFASVDYFPLLPWYGVMLIGSGLMAVARVRAALERIPDRCRPVAAAGRHTLAIYLLHQPLLLLTMRVWLGAP